MNKRLAARLSALAVLGLLAAACRAPVLPRAAVPTPAATASTSARSGAGSSAIPAADTPTGTGALASFQATLEQIAAAVDASIVQIDTSSGLGSGIVYDAIGDIVTNNHVVEGESSFTVKLADGKAYSASLVGSYSANDLAVLKVSGASGLKPAKFADSNTVRSGDIVLAIGSPFGLSGTVTEGIVSATGRSQSEGNGVNLSDLVQTSAPINPGNSGGALVNLDGAVIGIPTLAGSDSQGRQSSTGIGFAIPSNQVTNAAKQIVASGRVTHSGRPYLGVTTHDDPNGGAAVTSVVSGGAASKAGMQTGWAITGVGGHSVADTNGLSEALAGYKPGDRLDLTVRLPDGSTRTLSVTLGERPVNQ